MIFPIVRLLTHAALIWFFETWFLAKLTFTYFKCQDNPHILQYQGPMLDVQRTPKQVIVTWLNPDRPIKRKSQKRIERQGRRSSGRAGGEKKSWGHFKSTKNKKFVTNYAGFCFWNDANSKIITEITENHSQFLGERIAAIILFHIVHDKP